MTKKTLRFAVILCIILILTACSSKAERNNDDTKNLTETVTAPLTDASVEDYTEESELEPIVTAMSEPTAMATPTATPTPTPEPTESPYKNVSTGDIITFGSYEQDNDLSNGKELIEWIVLSYDSENKKALLLSKYGLDCKVYNENLEPITWENCSLRKWLNSDFYNTAFNDNEKRRIIETDVENKDNARESKTKGGNNTKDFIFLLSFYDIINTSYGFNPDYDSIDSNRKCELTAYAIGNGAYRDRTDEAGEWWLRTPGDQPELVAFVFSNGRVWGGGWESNYNNHFTVRPALYLNLKDLP